jgi:mannose-6-phosphate isomerase-like protein (cupin superfamily)
MKTALVLVSLMLAAAQTGGVPGFVRWTADELKSYDGKLKISAQTKLGNESLGKWGNQSALMTKRTGDGVAEVHTHVADYFVVEGGEATLVVGGTVQNPKTTAPGEVRGPAIDGGVRTTLRPGDVVRIPENTPHQLLVPNSFLYYVIKVESK